MSGLELDDKAFSFFKDFMTRIAKLEELVGLGNRLLVGFYQELELLRRPPLHKTSKKIVEEVVSAHLTERMKDYIDAGCITRQTAWENVSKLNSYHEGLKDHLHKAKVLLSEIACLSDEVINIMEIANESISPLSNDLSGDGMMNQPCWNEEKESKPLNLRRENILHYAIMMRVIYKMLKLDFEMQEKIVVCLSLKTSSEELDSYCLMWDLRPFMDDDYVRRAFKLIP
ncbi:hypothetical protein QJS10_CPB17g02433 [Acorus calamus]|uniref:DUF7795 domain-containing protein n=1 Tax=Acorus calamus TaxID=4465 RepID=A0AAV9CXH7_ACOCL|nr:hypothetical protein QJS10_CPB17g02433 [Acorus calamus]